MAHVPPEFICDSMLGRLAKNLRMLGFDALYARDADLKALMEAAGKQQRVLLTRRTALLKSSPGQPVLSVFIRSNYPVEQVREVLAACALKKTDLRPFTICLRCNARLEPLSKEAALDRVPEYVAATGDTFAACTVCGRVYWRGTHYAGMTGELEKIMGHQGAPAHPPQ